MSVVEDSNMHRQRSLDWIEQAPVLVHRDIVFVGDLRGRKNLLIRGKVLGNGAIQGTVILGPGSYWIGDLTADTVILNGVVVGNIIARVKLEIRDGGRVCGNIASPMIAAAHGGQIEGRIDAQGLFSRFYERRHPTSNGNSFTLSPFSQRETP